FEEARAEVAARDAEGVKSLRGGSDGRVDFSGRRFGEPGLEALLRRGINSVKRRCGVGARDPGDEVASVKRHQATRLTRVPIGAIVIRTSSPLRSEKWSGGTMPVPVIR